MADIDNIIRALDKYLRTKSKKSMNPPEANQWLERKGLLIDSVTRPGLPLRRLLRQGKLPHAYKVGRYWVIPLSNKHSF
jgi:hypothetical protein